MPVFIRSAVIGVAVLTLAATACSPSESSPTSADGTSDPPAAPVVTASGANHPDGAPGTELDGADGADVRAVARRHSVGLKQQSRLGTAGAEPQATD